MFLRFLHGFPTAIAMLVELRIRDFAVIRDLALEMGPGLNVLTGETGAGKSILIGALSLLLGERASSDVVRTGASRAVVEAAFDPAGREELRGRLEALGLPADEELLLLRREVQAEGRNRAWINGSPVAAGTVGEFGRALVDLHGQHEHQTLLDAGEQRTIVDAYAGAAELAARVRGLHGELGRLEDERASRLERVRELEGQADFLRFQLGEIRGAKIDPERDGEIEVELGRLDHAEELARDAGAAYRLLYGEEGAASERLAAARDLLRRIARVDPSLEGELSRLEELYHGAADAGRTLGDYASRVEVNPARAEELRSRLDLLFRLKRKYGPELTDVLEAGTRIEAELGELDGTEVALEELEAARARAAERLADAAGELGAVRREAAARLAQEVEAILPSLGLSGAVFSVDLEPLDGIGAHGGERVRFLASLNPGFEPRPLARIASGGELSRVMLALKTILSRVDRVPTLVFDEIDAGIGGTVAGDVARRLREVAERHQVLVVTHLPQVASLAHRHLLIEKETLAGVAATKILALEGEDRVREVARMLGGDPESPRSRDHARELLVSAARAEP